MRMSKNKPSKLMLVVVILISILFFYIKNQPGKQVILPAYYTANQAYQTGKFQEALEGFLVALKENPSLLQKEPLIRFKIGYGFFRMGEFRKTIDVFEKSRQSLEMIEDYLVYFQILSYFNMGDTLTSLEKIGFLCKYFDESPLIPLTDSLRAVVALKQNKPDSALKYLKLMLKSGQFEKTEIYLKIINLLLEKGDIKEFRKYGFILLRNYPFHNRSEWVYGELLKTYEGKINDIDFKKLLKFLFTTRQYLTSEDQVVRQAKFASSGADKDYFNWLPVEISYRQGEYQRVLDWCLSKRKYFRSLAILREIDLHIARCYLRTGRVKQSIKAYLDFQKRYPRDYLSAEVLWKVAWLFEEKFDLPKAIKTYQKLVKVYRKSPFRDEAYFRIGLDYYRLKKYVEARTAWQAALRRVNNRFQKDRLLYWVGKSYEMERIYKKQGEIYIELAKRPIDSFYNLKAFYLTSNGQDTHRQISESLWELHQQNRSFLPDYISTFKRALLVDEVLGSRWGDRELQAAHLNFEEWQAIFALGELYERMENYGDAYRRFRSIFNNQFSKANLPEMVPLFKKLYPFYYSNLIDSAAQHFSIPPALIWSVIKKESAFEPQIISYANAYGLMQLLPGTASQIAPNLGLRFTSSDQLFDPMTNIKMGSYYLSSLLRRYQGNYIMALAGYNAGPHRVDRWKKKYPTHDDDLFMENLEFEQTRIYVRTCMKFFWIYRAIMNPGEIPEEIVNYPVKIAEFL